MATFIITIGFLAFGGVYKATAKNYKSARASTGGVYVNGQYIKPLSGGSGGDSEKYKAFNMGGTIFFILAGVTGVICVASIISSKKIE